MYKRQSSAYRSISVFLLQFKSHLCFPMAIQKPSLFSYGYPKAVSVFLLQSKSNLCFPIAIQKPSLFSYGNAKAISVFLWQSKSHLCFPMAIQKTSVFIWQFKSHLCFPMAFQKPSLFSFGNSKAISVFLWHSKSHLCFPMAFQMPALLLLNTHQKIQLQQSKSSEQIAMGVTGNISWNNERNEFTVTHEQPKTLTTLHFVPSFEIWSQEVKSSSNHLRLHQDFLLDTSPIKIIQTVKGRLRNYVSIMKLENIRTIKCCPVCIFQLLQILAFGNKF